MHDPQAPSAPRLNNASITMHTRTRTRRSSAATARGCCQTSSTPSGCCRSRCGAARWRRHRGRAWPGGGQGPGRRVPRQAQEATYHCFGPRWLGWPEGLGVHSPPPAPHTVMSHVIAEHDRRFQSIVVMDICGDGITTNDDPLHRPALQCTLQLCIGRPWPAAALAPDASCLPLPCVFLHPRSARRQ